MITEYIAPELCEQFLGGIDPATFRRNKQHYMTVHNIKETNRKRGRYTIYTYEPKKEQSPQEKTDAKFLNILGCDIGGKNIELLKFILKSIIEREIVPGQDEIAYHANLASLNTTRGTVKNYMGFLKANGIIGEPLRIPVWIENPIKTREGKEIWVKREYDPETGEIFPTYYKKIVKQYYYDYMKTHEGVYRNRVDKLTQRALEMTFENIWPDEEHKHILPLYVLGYSPKYIKDQRMILKAKIIREIGTAYGMNHCRIDDEPIITIEKQLREYFFKAD